MCSVHTDFYKNNKNRYLKLATFNQYIKLLRFLHQTLKTLTVFWIYLCVPTFFGCSSEGDPFVAFCRNKKNELTFTAKRKCKSKKDKSTLLKLINVRIDKNCDKHTVVPGAAAAGTEREICQKFRSKQIRTKILICKPDLTCGVNTRLEKQKNKKDYFTSTNISKIN